MKLMRKEASVRWKGGTRGGTQVMNVAPGAPKQVRSPAAIPIKGAFTDPVALLAAAHAGSFSLALSNELGLAHSNAGNITTTTTMTLEHLAIGWTVVKVHLNVIAKLSGVTQCEFIDATVRAKLGCMVSRLFRGNISMNAKLEK
jgi:osmotically inducible protein OsmC